MFYACDEEDASANADVGTIKTSCDSFGLAKRHRVHVAVVCSCCAATASTTASVTLTPYLINLMTCDYST